MRVSCRDFRVERSLSAEASTVEPSSELPVRIEPTARPTSQEPAQQARVVEPFGLNTLESYVPVIQVIWGSAGDVMLGATTTLYDASGVRGPGRALSAMLSLVPSVAPLQHRAHLTELVDETDRARDLTSVHGAIKHPRTIPDELGEMALAWTAAKGAAAQEPCGRVVHACRLFWPQSIPSALANGRDELWWGGRFGGHVESFAGTTRLGLERRACRKRAQRLSCAHIVV